MRSKRLKYNLLSGWLKLKRKSLKRKKRIDYGKKKKQGKRRNMKMKSREERMRNNNGLMTRRERKSKEGRGNRNKESKKMICKDNGKKKWYKNLISIHILKILNNVNHCWNTVRRISPKKSRKTKKLDKLLLNRIGQNKRRRERKPLKKLSIKESFRELKLRKKEKLKITCSKEPPKGERKRRLKLRKKEEACITMKILTNWLLILVWCNSSQSLESQHHFISQNWPRLLKNWLLLKIPSKKKERLRDSIKWISSLEQSVISIMWRKMKTKTHKNQIRDHRKLIIQIK
jgi:hypothetical protein